MARILLAGATGHLGKHIAAELKKRNHWLRVLMRNPERPFPIADEIVGGDLNDFHSLQHACRETEVVISAAGASLSPSFTRRGKDYITVDYEGHLNLLRAAGEAGVVRMVYVSVFSSPDLDHLEYVRAHTRFADALKKSGLTYTIVQPTGFFCAFDAVLGIARKGIAPLIGNGEASTNPIHERDLARTCVDAIDGQSREVPVGGPDIFTRRQIFEMAFHALGKKPRFVRVPGGIVSAQITMLSLFNPRAAQLMAFLQQVNQVDVIAPAHGTRRLDAYFAEKAAQINHDDL